MSVKMRVGGLLPCSAVMGNPRGACDASTYDWRSAPSEQARNMARDMASSPTHPALAPAAAPAVRGQRASDRPARGIAIMALAVICFATNDAWTKHLTESFPPLQIVWARYVGHSLA